MIDRVTHLLKLGGLGVLRPDELDELGAATRRVLALMSDGRWHHPDEIRSAAGKRGQPASEGLRRMRELRQWFDIERQRAPETRVFWYRLAPKTIEVDPQLRLV